MAEVDYISEYEKKYHPTVPPSDKKEISKPVVETSPVKKDTGEVDYISEYEKKYHPTVPPSDKKETQPKVETQQEPPSIEFEMDDLDTKKDWIQQGKSIYKHEEGEKWKGSDKALAEWFKFRHSELANSLYNMGKTAISTNEMPDEVKEAWAKSLDTYDRTNSDFSAGLRAVWNTVADPTFLGSAIATGGMGGIARLAGGKAASIAARFAFKEQLKEALVKKGVSKKAAEKFIKEGAARGVSGEVLKGARQEAAKALGKSQMWTGAAGSGAWTGGYEVAKQSMDIGVDRTDQEDIDWENVGLFTILGVGLGGGVGKYIPRGTERIARKQALMKADKAQAAMIPRSDHINRNLGKNASINDVRSLATQAQQELVEDGTIEINTATIFPKKKNKKTNAPTIKEVKEEFNNAGIDIEEVSKGVYKGKKINDTIDEVASDLIPEGRSWGQRTIATIKRGLFDDSGVKIKGDDPEAFKKAQTRRSTAKATVARNIETRVRKLTKAIKKDYGIKDISKLNKSYFRRFDLALRGDKTAIEDLGKEAPKTLEQLRGMAENIRYYQNELIEQGVIKKDSPLGIKIKAQTKGKDPEIHITRQYEIYDNPNWTKTLNTHDGQKVVRAARNTIALSATKGNKEFGKVKNKVDRFVSKLQKEATLAEEPLTDSEAIARARRALSDEELKVYDSYMGKDGYVDKSITDILSVNNEEALMKVFGNIETLGKSPLKILTKRGDIPEEIRLLMGEYKDPFTNYTNTAMKLFQTIETHAYEKEIANLVRNGKMEKAQVGQTLAGDITTEIESKLPQRTGIDRPFDELEASTIPAFKPKTLFTTPEIASAIAHGNELAIKVFKPLQGYVVLQGHTRAAKTIWSPTAIARNFLGAGWMAMGAGYLRPSTLKGIVRVAKGLSKVSDAELRAEIEKGVHLGTLQSGVDMGAFKGALKDAGQEDFWNLSSPLYKGEKGLLNRAKKANTSMVKFYQSMDDMWKQFAFLNEKANYRQVMLDKGIDPDEVIRKFMSGDGIEVKITALDDFAASEVNKHMQNYAGVSQWVKGFRLAPMADFLAFTTESIRTQKNIIKTAFRDMKEGRELMKQGIKNADDTLKGQAQARVGERRLASVISAQAAAPALAATTAFVSGVDQKEEDQLYTIQQGIEGLADQPWQEGANFWYFGKPEKGEGKRLNLSYINPWARWSDPIRAGMRAFDRGEYVEGAVQDAIMKSVVNPLTEVFGLSMLAEGIATLFKNVDQYGRPVRTETMTLGEKLLNSSLEMWKAFEPGIFKSGKDIYDSYQLEGKPFGMRGNRKLYQSDQWMGLLGIKPEAYNLNDSLSIKLRGIKNNMGEAGKIFSRSYQDRAPVTVKGLTDSYAEALEKQYTQATIMFDLISKAKSSGMSDIDIINAVTDEGLFKKRLDKNIFKQMVRKGIFIPPKPNLNDMYKWSISTKKRTGQAPPLKEAQKGLIETYYSFMGSRTGTR